MFSTIADVSIIASIHVTSSAWCLLCADDIYTSLSCSVQMLSDAPARMFSGNDTDSNLASTLEAQSTIGDSENAWGSHPFAQQAGMNWLISFDQLVLCPLMQHHCVVHMNL